MEELQAAFELQRAQLEAEAERERLEDERWKKEEEAKLQRELELQEAARQVVALAAVAAVWVADRIGVNAAVVVWLRLVPRGAGS